MIPQHDSFEVLRDCRALYVAQFSQLLGNIAPLSSIAVKAATNAAGVYFDDTVASSRRGSFQEEAKGMTSSRITLVGEDDLELELYLDKMEARLHEAAGKELWKTHQYFITLLKRPDLAKLNNPVGPSGIGQGLKEMLAAMDGVSLDKKIDLLDVIETRLCEKLPYLYASLNDFFIGQGIAPASMVIATNSSPAKKTGPTSGSAADSSFQALQQALLSRLPNVPQEALSGQNQGGNTAIASLLSKATLERLIFRLDEFDRQMGGMPQVSTASNPKLENLIPGLFTTDEGRTSTPKSLSAAELGVPAMAPEALAIDTVALIFETIFEHPDLPETLKSIISSLQITILKIAMKDSRLFADTTHPARQLIDRMGWLMQGLPLDVSSRHPICSQLFAIATQVRGQYRGDLAIFEAPLKTLDDLIKKRNSEIVVAGQTFIPLLKKLEQGDLAIGESNQIIDQLLKRNVPESIRSFIDQIWRQVLQKIGLEHGVESTEWQASAHVIERLLWSFEPKQAADDRKALARQLPEILKLLKAGMESIAVPREAQAAFLDASFALQTQALRPVPVDGVSQEVFTQQAEAIPAMEEPRPASRISQRQITVGNLSLSTVGFFPGDQVPARALSNQAGEWLEIRLGKEALQRLQFSVLISQAQQWAVFFAGDLDCAWAIHPTIIEQKIKNNEARWLPAPSLFETAAERALQKTTGAGRGNKLPLS